MPWWAWIVGGIAILVGELLTTGTFSMFFFGVAAAIVGLLVAAGALPSESWQWGVFVVLSVILVFNRRPLLKCLPSKKTTPDAYTLVGSRGRASEHIGPGAQGKVDAGGSSWSAKNVGTEPLEAGESFEVVGIDELTLSVKKI
jgi:membrane protein implicated in regulation of membrane protease activity